MWHRKPEKYKEYEGMGNIIVGQGELPMVKTKQGIGWITLEGKIIYNKQEAISYATKINKLIQFNKQRIMQQRNRFK